MYSGDDYDLLRWTGIRGAVSCRYGQQSAKTGPGNNLVWYSYAMVWQRPRPNGFNMSLCDGSVHALNYSIDGEVYRRFGNRQDRKPVDDSQF